MTDRRSITDLLALRRNTVLLLVALVLAVGLLTTGGSRRTLLLFNALTRAGCILLLVWCHPPQRKDAAVMRHSFRTTQGVFR